MKSESLKVYADTSVFGGVWDPEFSHASGMFFEQVSKGFFLLHVSPLVETELRDAPQRVRAVFAKHIENMTVVTAFDQAEMLKDAYLKAGILTRASEEDALHVALATVSRCDIIVSWNFRHIVHHGKIGLYNAVNVMQGHREIAIYSPREVIRYED